MNEADTWFVPANCARYFADQSVALAQPTARLDLVWDPLGHYIHNRAYDGTLIRHDNDYYTGVVNLEGVAQVPTLDYFSRVAGHFDTGFRTIDIGCGQGEFVNGLLDRGYSATGFDPVLETPMPHLVDRYWKPGDASADLYVMRCVLPHIPDPWRFLRAIAEADPGARVLVEFQSLDWIADQSIWYQLSHDHVNLFRPQDFSARFSVIDSGHFSDGEWAWVLIDPRERPLGPPVECERPDAISNLFKARGAFLSAARESDRAIVVWGAAGKGQVLCHAMAISGVSDVVAVDADDRRWGRFLEGSGVEVISPELCRSDLMDRQVLVANPSHLEVVRAHLAQGRPSGLEPMTPEEFARDFL